MKVIKNEKAEELRREIAKLAIEKEKDNEVQKEFDEAVKKLQEFKKTDEYRALTIKGV